MNLLTLSSIFCYLVLYLSLLDDLIMGVNSLFFPLINDHLSFIPLSHRQLYRKRTSFSFMRVYDDLSFVQLYNFLNVGKT